MIGKCKACGAYFQYYDEDVRWDEKGYGYSTKYVKCSNCGRFHIIKFYEDPGLDVNNDPRFYTYKRTY